MSFIVEDISCLMVSPGINNDYSSRFCNQIGSKGNRGGVERNIGQW